MIGYRSFLGAARHLGRARRVEDAGLAQKIPACWPEKSDQAPWSGPHGPVIRHSDSGRLVLWLV